MSSPFQCRLLSLETHLESRSEFSRRFLQQTPHGGVIVDVAQEVEEDALVELMIRISGENEKHRLRGAVLWMRDNALGTKTIGVAFLATEAEKREKLLCSEGYGGLLPDNSAERVHPRHPVVLQVSYLDHVEDYFDYTRNISRGGLCVASSMNLEKGDSLSLRLHHPKLQEGIDLDGEIAWSDSGSSYGFRLSKTADLSRSQVEQLVHGA